MKKYIPVLLLIFLFLYVPHLYAQSQVDLNTYYVSPYGSYFAIRLYPRASLGTNCSADEIGTLYTDETLNARLFLCHQSQQWGLISSKWSKNDNADITGIIDYVYYNGPANVGIGTLNPQEKLHIVDGELPASAVNPVVMRIESAASDAPSLHLQDGGSDSYLTFDSSSPDDIILSTDDESIRLRYEPDPATSGDEEELTYENGNLGINDTSPEALLEIAGPAAAGYEYFTLDGNIFYVDLAGNNVRIGIDNITPPAPLAINPTDPNDSEPNIDFLHPTDGDLRYAGDDDDVNFVHTGHATNGQLRFDYNNINTNLARLSNEGNFHISSHLKVDAHLDPTINSAVELEVAEGDSSGSGVARIDDDVAEDTRAPDPLVIFSDQDTHTNVDCPTDCPYIEEDVIGLFTSLTSDEGGLLVLGISPGATGPNTPALRLSGVTHTHNNGGANFAQPAVSIGGLYGSGSINPPAKDDSHIILTVNFDTADGVDFSTFTAGGTWGIGMQQGAPYPETSVHIRSVMKLEPTNTIPTCHEGTIFVDDNSGATPALCYCRGGGVWDELWGTGCP